MATAPAGKAIVLTSIDIDAYSLGTGSTYVKSVIGASDCSNNALDYHDFTERGERQLTFNPGLVIHPGESLLMSAISIGAQVLATGYTVPANAVPAKAKSTQAANVSASTPVAIRRLGPQPSSRRALGRVRLLLALSVAP